MILVNEVFWYTSNKYELLRLLIASEEVLGIGNGYNAGVLKIIVDTPRRTSLSDIVSNVIDALERYYGYEVHLHNVNWYYRSPYYENKNKLLIHSKLSRSGRLFTSMELNHIKSNISRFQKYLDQTDPKLQIEYYSGDGKIIR